MRKTKFNRPSRIRVVRTVADFERLQLGVILIRLIFMTLRWWVMFRRTLSILQHRNFLREGALAFGVTDG